MSEVKNKPKFLDAKGKIIMPVQQVVILKGRNNNIKEKLTPKGK